MASAGADQSTGSKTQSQDAAPKSSEAPSAEKLAAESAHAGFLSDVYGSFINTLKSQSNGVIQLVNKAGAHIDELKPEQVDNPDSSFSAWSASLIGQAGGMAAEFFVARKLGAATRFFLGKESGAAVLTGTESAASKMYSSVGFGAFMGGVLTPSSDAEHFWQDRFKNTLSSSVSIGGMTGISLGLEAQAAKLSSGTLAATLRNGYVNNAIGGIIGGSLGDMTSMGLNGQGPSLNANYWKHVGQSGAEFALVGMGTHTLNLAGAGAYELTQQRPGTDTTNGRYLTNKLGLTKADSQSGLRAEFRVVSGSEQLQHLQDNLKNGASNAQAELVVQQRLHTAMSGLFGERFTKYGRDNSLLLSHGQLEAEAVARAKLIATCSPLLSAELRSKDVFPNRSEGDERSRSVWLSNIAEDRFILNRGQRPLVEQNQKSEAVRLGISKIELDDWLGNFHGWLNNLKALVTADPLSVPEIRAAARAGLIDSLSKGYTNEVFTLLRAGNHSLISADDLRSPEVQNAARVALIKLLSEGESYPAKELMEVKAGNHSLISADTLRSPEVRDAARAGLIMFLSEGRPGDAQKLMELKAGEQNLLSTEDLRSPKVRDAARAGFIELLSNGGTYGAEKFLELKAGEQSLLSIDDLPFPEVRDAARAGLIMSLSRGLVPGALKLMELKAGEQNLLSTDALRSPEVRDAARAGFIELLSNGWPVGAKLLLELKVGEQSLLSTDDLRSPEARNAARAGLVKSLFSGRIHDALKLMEMKAGEQSLLSTDYLRSPEVRDAAHAGFIKLLSNGWPGEAQKLMELKVGEQNLLSIDDLPFPEVRDAARAGLLKCLSEGRNSHFARAIIDLKSGNENVLDQSAVDNVFKQAVKDGFGTSSIRFAMQTYRLDAKTALKKYADIPKLTDDTAGTFFTDLKTRDPLWKDAEHVQRPFERGAEAFGASTMMRYIFGSKATPHDALIGFDHVIELYKRSGLSKEQFDGNILSQVSNDDAPSDAGPAYSRLAAISRDFPTNITDVVNRAKELDRLPDIHNLTDAFQDEASVFKNWRSLERFADLQRYLDDAAFLKELAELRNTDPKLADWLSVLSFHKDSRVPKSLITEIWKNPESFIDRDDSHAGKLHQRKKPSNYTEEIPFLDLTARQLRDALIRGKLDELQVFSPMKVEYELGGSSLQSELNRAIGSRAEERKGEATNANLLYAKVRNLLKSELGLSEEQFKQWVRGDAQALSQQMQQAMEQPELVQKVDELLYSKNFGLNDRPQPPLRFIAEIHRKSDPLATVVGDDTANCMGFGTGKNNVYMFNPNDAIFTVRLVNSEGKARTIAESLLTKDMDIGMSIPKLMEDMTSNPNALLDKIKPEQVLHNKQAVIAADNVEVHPNHMDKDAALEAVYTDFFARYIAAHGAAENIQADKIIIGTGHNDAMNHLPREDNTYLPQAPVGYSDKTGEKVLSLSLTGKPSMPLHVVSIEDAPIAGRIKPATPVTSGVSPLTFEDTLPVAYLESAVYAKADALRVGPHNMENALIAKDINNAAKGRPNLSLKYVDKDGNTKAYMLAYEGRYKDSQNTNNEEGKPVIFISDFVNSKGAGDSGRGEGTPISEQIGGGKLLLEFGKLYKENYLDNGRMMPILANARDNTSYALVMNHFETLGKKLGYRFEVKELDTYKQGSDTMHDVLITPHRLSLAPPGL
jgi:hypothetical protein